MESANKRISLRVTASEADKLRRYAAEYGISLNDAIRQAIRAMIDKDNHELLGNVIRRKA